MDLKLEDILKEYNQLRPEKARTHFCHAPFVSLNFEQNGNITACCYNRTFVLGKFPENSVSEIWHSTKTEELRQSIRDLDFSKGCEACYDLLVSRNFSSMLTKNFDRLEVSGEDAAKLGPRIMEFETSNICNLECIMCNGYFSSSIRKNREKLPPLENPYTDELVDQVRPFLKNLEWIKFLGGEPFMNPLYFKIWRALVEEKSNAKVVITTNASVMNSKVKWVLENVKPMLVLSIDSMQKESYEKIRVNANFDKTMENLIIFTQYAIQNGRTIDLSVCPMTLNWKEIPDLLNWGTKNSIQVNFNTLTRPPELSLKFQPKTDLEKILFFYKNANIKNWSDYFSDATPWTKTISNNNNLIFKNFVNQIHAWHEQA